MFKKNFYVPTCKVHRASEGGGRSLYFGPELVVLVLLLVLESDSAGCGVGAVAIIVRVGK